MKSRAKLSDVAQEAGVSNSTVSFVLNKNRPISKEVTERVMAAVEKLQYKPNQAARMLSSHRNKIIGVLVITCNDPFTGVILESINHELTAKGYRMQLCIAGEGRKNALNAIGELSSGGTVDGIINMLPDLSVSETLQNSNSVPIITYLRPQITSPVYVDFIAGMTTALEHLYSLGHRKIGFIGEIGRHSQNDIGEEPRLSGFKQFLVKSRLEENLDLIEFGYGTLESGIQAAGRIYRKGASAIACINDQTAAGVLYWCHENGIKVPDRLSVVGFDDSPIATFVYPPLTTIQLPAEELAKMTVEAIIGKIDGKKASQHQVLRPQLIVRNSTSPLEVLV